MVIEMNKKMDKETAKEFTCVLFNASQLHAKPHRKLSNVFSFCWKTAIFIFVALLFFGFFLIKGDRDVMTTTGALISVICVVFLIVFAVKVNRVYQSIYKRTDDKGIMTLSERGINYEVVGRQTYQTSWECVAFARLFSKSAYVFPSEITGMIFSVEKEHWEEFKQYLKENQPNIEIIE